MQHFALTPLVTPIWISFALAIVLTLGTIWAILGVPSGRARVFSLTLRLGVWLCALTLIFRPAWVNVEKEPVRKPLAIVVDRSESMSLTESGNQSRLDQSQSWLANDPLWKALEHRFDLRWFSLGKHLYPSSREELRSIKLPLESETALDSALSDLSSQPSWAASVWMTDGVDTGIAPQAAKDSPSHPFFFLSPKSESNSIDAAILSVNGPDIAYSKGKMEIDVDVEAHGVPLENMLVRARLGEKNVAETLIPINMWKGGRATVPLVFTLDRPGPAVLTIEIPKFPREVTYDNNVAFKRFRILRDRLRVLHVSGTPSWDERFLREHLKENPNIDLVSFFILRSPTDYPEASQDELSLIPFPYQDLFTKDLNQFDLVIFQNFDFKTYFSPFYLSHLREFVSGGGAFLMVGGDRSFGQGGYAGTVVEDILPVTLLSGLPELSLDSFQPRVSEKASRHPALSGALNDSILRKLPTFWGVHRADSIRPGAVSLLEHPKERLGSQGLPVLVVGTHGEGRVGALLTDTTWRWAISGDSAGLRTYQKFWEGLLQWLTGDAADGRIKMAPLKPLRSQQAGSLRVSILTDSYEPRVGARVKLTLKPYGENPETLTSSPTGPDGTVDVPLPAFSVGPLAVEAEIVGDQSQGAKASDIFLVEPASREFLRRDVDETHMKVWAKASQGEVFSMSGSSKNLIDRLESHVEYRVVGKKETPLWDTSVVLLMFLILSCTEWWLRRKNGAA